MQKTNIKFILKIAWTSNEQDEHVKHAKKNKMNIKNLRKYDWNFDNICTKHNALQNTLHIKTKHKHL